MNCSCGSETVEHTIFRCSNGDGLRIALCERLDKPPEVVDNQNILYESLFEDLPADNQKKAIVLKEAEEMFRIF